MGPLFVPEHVHWLEVQVLFTNVIEREVIQAVPAKRTSR
jgi:hypothetical protein